MKVAEEFEDYVKMSKDLQRIALEKLDQDELKAFAINIYNALVIHATIVNGPPTNWFTRAKVKLRKTCFLCLHLSLSLCFLFIIEFGFFEIFLIYLNACKLSVSSLLKGEMDGWI